MLFLQGGGAAGQKRELLCLANPVLEFWMRGERKELQLTPAYRHLGGVFDAAESQRHESKVKAAKGRDAYRKIEHNGKRRHEGNIQGSLVYHLRVQLFVAEHRNLDCYQGNE